MAVAQVRQIVLAYARDRLDGVELKLSPDLSNKSEEDSVYMKKIAPDLYMHVIEVPQSSSYSFSLHSPSSKDQPKVSAPGGEGLLARLNGGAGSGIAGGGKAGLLTGEALMMLATSTLCRRHFHKSSNELHLSEADYKSILESGHCACSAYSDPPLTPDAAPTPSTLSDNAPLERGTASEHIPTSHGGGGASNDQDVVAQLRKDTGWSYSDSQFKTTLQLTMAANEKESDVIEGGVIKQEAEHHILAQQDVEVLFTSWGSSDLYSLSAGEECRQQLYDIWMNQKSSPTDAQEVARLEEELSDGELEEIGLGSRLLRLLAGARFRLLSGYRWREKTESPPVDLSGSPVRDEPSDERTDEKVVAEEEDDDDDLVVSDANEINRSEGNVTVPASSGQGSSQDMVLPAPPALATGVKSRDTCERSNDGTAEENEDDVSDSEEENTNFSNSVHSDRSSSSDERARPRRERKGDARPRREGRGEARPRREGRGDRLERYAAGAAGTLTTVTGHAAAIATGRPINEGEENHWRDRERRMERNAALILNTRMEQLRDAQQYEDRQQEVLRQNQMAIQGWMTATEAIIDNRFAAMQEEIEVIRNDNIRLEGIVDRHWSILCGVLFVLFLFIAYKLYENYNTCNPYFNSALFPWEKPCKQ